MPYIGFFLSYLIYVLYIFGESYDNATEAFEEGSEIDRPTWFAALNISFMCALFLFSFYFLKQEYRQVKKLGWSYFTSVWNWADFGPPIIIIILMLIDLKTANTKTAHVAFEHFRFSMQAIANFGMWIKILYFLRIFRETGFFVNMLLRVIKDAKVFFYIYVLILAAFASSYFIMSSTTDGLLYHLNYSYLLGLGEFEMDWQENYYTPLLMESFFVLATLFILIVMLNLLIAIVSTTYEQVIETQQEANDFERVDLIADTAEFIRQDLKHSPCKDNEYLIKAQAANTKRREEEKEKDD